MKYQKLEKTVKVKGVGIPTLTATLIERTEKKAFYKRDDNVFEVFFIKTQVIQTMKILEKLLGVLMIMKQHLIDIKNYNRGVNRVFEITNFFKYLI